MEYTIAKLIHVTLAIVAFGSNLTYAIWIVRAARDPQHLPFVLSTIRVLDGRFANPAYGLLLVTGLFMVLTAGYPLTTFWIAAALALYTLVLVLGLLVIAPNFRAQVRALEREGASSPAFRSSALAGRVWGALVTLIVLAIVFLMVVKPTLGG